MRIGCCGQINYFYVLCLDNWMIYEFGQGICVCMLTCSNDNFYEF